MRTPLEKAQDALRRILEISYSGHPDGREDRLTMIHRYAEDGLKVDHEWEFYVNGSFCKRCGTQIGSGEPCR